MLLSEVKAEARLVSGNEPRYFFATRSKQTINFPVAVRWHLTRHVHARKARRWLPSPDIVFTPSSNPVAGRFRNQRRDLGSQNSRGDWTAIEPLVAGVRRWDGRLLLWLGR